MIFSSKKAFTALFFAAALWGCDSSDDSNASDGTGASTDSGFDVDSDFLTGDKENGQTCWMFDECQSGFCSIYQGAPDPGDGVCEDALPLGMIRIQGNVNNFENLEDIEGVTVEILPAMASVSDPTGAKPLGTAVSGADGRFELDLNTREPAIVKLGLVARASKEGFATSITGLVEPEVDPAQNLFPPAVRNHDVQLVPLETVQSWSEALGAEEALAQYLPLVDKGGIFVSLRNVETGQGYPGAQIVSQNPNSQAIVRYLNEGGESFNAEATTSTGKFVIIRPGIAERFIGVQDGETITHRPGTMGGATGAAYVNMLHVLP